MKNHILILFIVPFFFAAPNSRGDVLPKNAIVAGLHPIHKEVKAGEVTFGYQTAFHVTRPGALGEVVRVFDEALQFQHWTCEWSIHAQPSPRSLPLAMEEEVNPDQPYYIHTSMRYTGPMDLTEQQLDHVKPVILLLPVAGIQTEIKPYHQSWSEWLGSFFAEITPPTRLTGTSEQPANLVLFMIDTLRADHTPPYGHPFVIAPHIEMLANLGSVFTASYGASSSTRPSVGSMFSGLQPYAHGAVRHSLTGADLYSNIPILPQTAQQYGMETIGISSNSQVTAAFGFSRGFDRYDCPVGEHQVTPKALRYLNSVNEPFFLYLHYMAPHAPYNPSSPFKDLYEGQTEYEELDRYCAEITLDDQRIGRVLKELADQGLLNRTAIWLVSDHGEEFWEHNWNGHGANLYQESVRTVSILSSPHGYPMGQRIHTPVMHADMLPTLSDLFGWKQTDFPQGKSLLPLLHQTHEEKEDSSLPTVFLHHGGGLEPGSHPSDKQAVLQHPYKLVWWNEKDEWELYHLENDPLEQRNLAESTIPTITDVKSLLTKRLRNHLEATQQIGKKFRSQSQSGSLYELTDKDIENLRAAGYLQ